MTGGKDTCCATLPPEFCPWVPCKRNRREPTPWGYLLMSTCIPGHMCHLTTSHTLVELKFDVKLLKSLWDQYSNVGLVCHISNNTFRNSHDGVYPPGEHKGRGPCTWAQPGQYSRSQTRAVQRLKHAVMCLHPGAALYVPNPSPPTSVQGRGYLKKMNSLHKLLTGW